ncbi:hypothetical protein D3C72_2071670 [compost metagenome]
MLYPSRRTASTSAFHAAYSGAWSHRKALKRRSSSLSVRSENAATNLPVALISAGKRLPTSTCNRNGAVERDNASTTMWSPPATSTPIAVTLAALDSLSSTGCTSVGKGLLSITLRASVNMPTPRL